MRYPGLVVMCQWLSIRLGKDGMGVVGEYKLHTQADMWRGTRDFKKQKVISSVQDIRKETSYRKVAGGCRRASP